MPEFHGGEDKHRVLVNYIRDVADKMGLKDWQFSIEDKPSPHGEIACTEVWADSHTASVWVGTSFFQYGPRMQREVIVHELTHWHTDKLVRMAKSVVREQVGGSAAEVAGAAITHMHELAVDGIAAAWARTFPLIDWKDAKPIYHEYERHVDEGVRESD